MNYQNILLISEELKNILVNAGFECEEYDNYDRKGYKLVSGSKDRAIELLRKNHFYLYDRITRGEDNDITFCFFNEKYNVNFDNWNGNNDNAFYRIAYDILARDFKHDVLITVPHRCISSPRSIEKIREIIIKFWSAPIDTGNTQTPRKIWGHSVSQRDSSFEFTGKGIGIFDGDYCVAELFEHNLYITSDLSHCGKEDDLAIFQKILERVVEILKKTPEELVVLKEESQKILDRQLENKFIRMCLGNINENIDNLERDLQHTDLQIRNQKDAMKTYIRNRDENLAKLEILKDKEVDIIKMYENDFDNIMAHRKITHIQIREHNIDLWTNTIYALDPKTNKIYELGAFHITIDQQNQEIYYDNLTRKVHGFQRGMNGPHLYEDKKPCWGDEFGEQIKQLFIGEQLATLIYEILRFPEYVNTKDSAGAHVEKWPEVDPKSIDPKDWPGGFTLEKTKTAQASSF